MKLLKIGLYSTLLSLSACQKRDDSSMNTADLNIQIETPTLGQSFSKGDTVLIRATASYKGELHGYEISIQTADSTELWQIDKHAHGNNIHVDTFWINDRNTAETLNLQLTVEADHEGNKKKTSIQFQTRNK